MAPPTEPIYLILSGLRGIYTSIPRASNYHDPALQWCRSELDRTFPLGEGTATDFPSPTTWEMSTWGYDEQGKHTRYGFTVIEKELVMKEDGDEDKENGENGEGVVYVVCQKGKLDEIEFVGTEEEAERVRAGSGRGGAVVEKVPYVRAREESP
ncbi:MAG: hypothetical protein Q9169_008655, partial [Polycauliona sp. 2 TL-2023]